MAEKKRRTTSDGALVESAPRKYVKPKPSFTVDEKALPQIKSWSVGKKYKLEIEVEMQSHSKGDTFGPAVVGEKKTHEARLTVLSIKPEDSEDEE